MSEDKDVDNVLRQQQSTPVVGLQDYKMDSDHSNKAVQDMKNYSHNAAIETVSSMNRELQALYEKYLELGVRSHLLEVDLATQFSPDLVLALEDLNENCNTYSQAVEELMHVSESSEEQKEYLDNHMHEHV